MLQENYLKLICPRLNPLYSFDINILEDLCDHLHTDYNDIIYIK